MKDLKTSALALELRNARLNKISNKKFDLLVIGAGVHGALVSWIAAKLGYSVLVIDQADYGHGTSSRSSKLLHGGVRYLEQGNLSLVYKSLVERREFMKMAPHLTRNLPFLFTVKPDQTAPAWMVQLGLAFYENVAKFWSKYENTDYKIFSDELKSLGLESSKLVPYHDAQVNDVRFCIEAICEAKSLGAETYNYLAFNKAEKTAKTWKVELEDRVSKEKFIIEADKIANVSGAAVKNVHLSCFESWPKNWPEITYSTGVHLFFDIELADIGLILPAETKGRYYFLLPVFSPYRKGIYLGTTDRKISNQDCYPKASEEEIGQLLKLIKRDLPNLDISKMYHSISGTRVLAGGSEQSHKLSREEQILVENDYISLLGGKYTTARSTAHQILEKLFLKKFKKLDLILSGSRSYSESDKNDVELNAAFNRFGIHAMPLIDLAKDEVIKWQIKYCIEKEQAVIWEDIFSRRLNLDFLSPENSVRKNYESLNNIKDLS